MKRKQASLVINPRAGQNLMKISDILAVLAAAGWKTDPALKEYGGHTMKLAKRAAEKRYDMVIAYGGDGTLNQVINGVMYAKRQNSIVGLIPGGTANVWASEIGIPADPVKAVLALVDSNARKVDVGHVAVEGLTSQDEQQHGGEKSDKKHTMASSQARQYFLLMAGLGIDAAIMSNVSKPLKYRLGPLAVGVSAAKELPSRHTFPVEVRSGDRDNAGILWKGEALQVVIGNTRLYADIVQMTPEAYMDDGILDLCIITAGNPLTTMQQIASLLLRHQPNTLTTEYFRGAHFSLSVPASIALQLDGSAVKLKDYLSGPDRKSFTRLDEVTVTYRFDVMPHAINLAIPHAYDGALFEKADTTSEQPVEIAQTSAESETSEENKQKYKQQEQPTNQASQQGQQVDLERFKALLEHGRKVTVVGVSPNLAEKEVTYIIAGSITKRSTGQVRPVAVRINADTLVLKQTGDHISPKVVPTLHEGDTIIVGGKKGKCGVILARQVVV